MTEQEYSEHIDKLLLDIANNPARFPTPDDVAKQLIFDMEENKKVYDVASRVLRLKPNAIKQAEKRLQRELEQAERQLQKEVASAKRETEQTAARLELQGRRWAVLGSIVGTEREYVTAFMKKYTMHYSGAFYLKGRLVKTSEVSADLLLTASDLGFVKPRGEELSVSAISLALEEWIIQQKHSRKAAAWSHIASLPPDFAVAAVLDDFQAVCEGYFKEPAFAMAAIIKGVWQVKRKLAGLPIEAHHMIVLQGMEQGGGKTTFIRKLLSPIKEISGEADASQVVDDRAIDLRELYAVFVDELAKAERVDVTKLKNIITGEMVTSRILYSHNTQQTQINMTLFGSINKPLGTIVYDTSGMRRFIEIQPKERAEVEPNWHLVEKFDWLRLWQAIDHTAEDPMLPFNEELRQKQEEMRFKDNVEEWLYNFVPEEHGANSKHHVNGEYIEFYASQLFEIFQNFERFYCPASKGTSMQLWGRTMKTLIDESRFPQWEYRQSGPKRIYLCTISNVVSLDAETALHRKMQEMRAKAKL